MRAPLLLADERDALAKGLRVSGFFGAFEYDAQVGDWARRGHAVGAEAAREVAERAAKEVADVARAAHARAASATDAQAKYIVELEAENKEKDTALEEWDKEDAIAETAEKARREAEEKARREAEEKARREAEEKARRETEEKARREAEAKARREAEEKARREAEAKARRETEEKARREVEAKARREAEEKARREAEAKAQREAEEKAQREAEATAPVRSRSRHHCLIHTSSIAITAARSSSMFPRASRRAIVTSEPTGVARCASCAAVPHHLPPHAISVLARACASDGDRRRWRGVGHTATLDYRGLVFYMEGSQAISNGDRVVYGGKGEVVGPATLETHKGKGLKVQFPGNTGPIDCFLTQLSRAAPPTTLPGGYRVGDEVFYTGEDYTFPSGDRLVYGGKGEVVGPATNETVKGKGVDVMFPGNTGRVSCFLTGLSRAAPPTTLLGGYRVGDEVFFASHTFPDDTNRLVYSGKGEVVGPATNEAVKGTGVDAMFPGNKAITSLPLTMLSRTAPYRGPVEEGARFGEQPLLLPVSTPAGCSTATRRESWARGRGGGGRICGGSLVRTRFRPACARAVPFFVGCVLTARRFFLLASILPFATLASHETPSV